MRTPADITLSKRDRAAIQAAAATLRAALPVERVVLFGSKARGDADAESDIDLLVVTRRPLTREEGRSITALLYPIQLEQGVILSTIEVSRDDWEQGPLRVLPLRSEIDRDGVAA